MDIFAEIIRWFFRQLKKLRRTSEDTAHFEVERKFRITQAEYDSLPTLLKSKGFVKASPTEMTDTFIPTEKPEDLIRVRDETAGGVTTTILTLKHWAEVAGNRERKENETKGIDSNTRGCIIALGKRLNKGEELLSYSKSRVPYEGKRDGCPVTVALDFAEGLGEHSGPYLEVEIIVIREEDVPEARKLISTISGELLGDGERPVALPYLEMLRKARAAK